MTSARVYKRVKIKH